MLLFIVVAVPKMEPKNVQHIGTALNRYFQIIVILALTTVVSVMVPDPVGFLLSLIVSLFFGLPYRLGTYFLSLNIPLIVRISLCIADAAAFLIAFCYCVSLLFTALFREQTAPTADDWEENESVTPANTQDIDPEDD